MTTMVYTVAGIVLLTFTGLDIELWIFLAQGLNRIASCILNYVEKRLES